MLEGHGGLPAKHTIDTGDIRAAAGRIVLHELTPQLASLEDAFMETTAASLEYGVPGAGPAAPPGQPGASGDAPADGGNR